MQFVPGTKFALSFDFEAPTDVTESVYEAALQRALDRLSMVQATETSPGKVIATATVARTLPIPLHFPPDPLPSLLYLRDAIPIGATL